jgi:hypothetical protein
MGCQMKTIGRSGIRIVTLAAVALILCVTARAGGNSPSQDFLLARTPQTDFYAYVGAEWLQQPDGAAAWGLPVELSAVTPGDWQFALDSSALRPDDEHGFIAGDTFSRIAKGIRGIPGIDYLSFEYDELLVEASEGFTGNVERAFQARAQGGYTRLGYDVSITDSIMRSSPGLGGDLLTTSVGYRGQFGWLHVGLDLVTAKRQGIDRQDSVDMVFMKRRSLGDSIYARLGKGVSGDSDAWYISTGFEFRFGR